MKSLVLAIALGWFAAWRMDDIYRVALENRWRLRKLVSVRPGEIVIRVAPSSRQDWGMVARNILEHAFPEEE
jgi:hypothetical protein